MVHPNRTKSTVEMRTAMEKLRQTNLAKQPFSSSGMIFYNANENRQQQQGDAKSFVAKIKDTLSDRNMVERGDLIDIELIY